MKCPYRKNKKNDKKCELYQNDGIYCNVDGFWRCGKYRELFNQKR